MNIIAIKGRLVRDPECKKTQNGVTVCNITVAVDRAYSNGGEKQTDFFDCVFWRQGAEFVSKYFSKGKEIIVHGEMQSRKWQDKRATTAFLGKFRTHTQSSAVARATIPLLLMRPSATLLRLTTARTTFLFDR